MSGSTLIVAVNALLLKFIKLEDIHKLEKKATYNGRKYQLEH